MQNNIKNRVSKILIFFSVFFTSYGLYRGEVTTVLKKAISICLECIGVG